MCLTRRRPVTTMAWYTLPALYEVPECCPLPANLPVPSRPLHGSISAGCFLRFGSNRRTDGRINWKKDTSNVRNRDGSWKQCRHAGRINVPYDFRIQQ
ncbi:uncharacterized protein LOC129747872 isoform X2 [Uranotaenia lowii]|uniref:uncharacterized protein LOC129747872 isoform X2 n=1 Tax=Uranotaenia lowii TaxID=190385 RepID=UPI00247AD5EF|nr:uncharacterized protein LOC129747872 isoform X2 [Uranotaenia lowii]